MSDEMRIALVAEGPTDGIVINSAIKAILGARSFVLKQIFPASSASFDKMGTGWIGVYKWCKQAASRGGGSLSGDHILFLNFDILILHVDADVAGFRYSDGSVTPGKGDGILPCERPCPPACDSADEMRRVLLSWCGEEALPAKTTICMPSKSTEAWVVAILFPQDVAVRQGIECFPDAESRLGQQPKGQRLKKKLSDYIDRESDFVDGWPTISAPGALVEARRFQSEFLAVVPPPQIRVV